MSIFRSDEFDGVDTVSTVVGMVRAKCDEMIDSKAIASMDDYSRGVRRGHNDAALSVLAVLHKVRYDGVAVVSAAELPATTRRIRHIWDTNNGRTVTLMTDETLWSLEYLVNSDRWKWRQLPSVPQPGEDEDMQDSEPKLQPEERDE